MRQFGLLAVFLIVGLIEYQVPPSGNGIYTQCSNGQVLKNQTGNWTCADDNNGNLTIINATIDARNTPYWVNQSSVITSNSSIYGGNVNVTGNMTIANMLLYPASTSAVFNNENNVSPDANGKTRFITTYNPNQQASNVGNLFSSDFASGSTAATATLTLNQFNANFKSYNAPGFVMASTKVTGTEFNNNLEGRFTGTGFSIWDVRGVVYNVLINGTYNGVGMGMTPMKVIVNMNASASASHYIKGLEVETTYNARNTPNNLYSFFGKTNYMNAASVANLGIYHSQLSLTPGVGTITGEATNYLAFLDFNVMNIMNTSLNSGKSYNVFMVDGETWVMPNRSTIGFYAKMMQNNTNIAFKSDGADGWMNKNNTAWMFGTHKSFNVSFNDNNGLLSANTINITNNLIVTNNITAIIYHGMIDWINVPISLTLTGTTACDQLDNIVSGYSYTCQSCVDSLVGTSIPCSTIASVMENCACKVG